MNLPLGVRGICSIVLGCILFKCACGHSRLRASDYKTENPTRGKTMKAVLSLPKMGSAERETEPSLGQKLLPQHLYWHRGWLSTDAKLQPYCSPALGVCQPSCPGGRGPGRVLYHA